MQSIRGPLSLYWKKDYHRDGEQYFIYKLIFWWCFISSSVYLDALDDQCTSAGPPHMESSYREWWVWLVALENGVLSTHNTCCRLRQIYKSFYVIHQVLINEKQPKMNLLLLILMERFLHGICTMNIFAHFVCMRWCVCVCVIPKRIPISLSLLYPAVQ